MSVVTLPFSLSVLHDHALHSCCGCLDWTASAQSLSDLSYCKLLVTVSWTKPTWDHHKVHWNGEKGDQQTSQAQGKEK